MDSRWIIVIALLLDVFAVIPGILSAAHAQDYRAMSCEDLWYARNEIYAERGYCFKTQRARAVFGRGCFPPYGDLSPTEMREVARIEQWEMRKGCR